MTLADTLVAAFETKREELAVSIWLATMASEEFERLWHVPEQLGDYDVNADLPLESALGTLAFWVTEWLAGRYDYDESAFENALGVVRHGNAGYWLRAAALISSELDAANALVFARLDRRPLCFNQQPSQQGRILLNVVQQFFVGDVQVWAADINRVLYRVLAPHRQLEQALAGVQPAGYLQWAAERDAQLGDIQAAPKSHVTSLAPVLSSCGLLPAAN